MLSPEQCAQQLHERRCLVVVPTYNNKTTLKKVIDSILPYTTYQLSSQQALQHLLVVNDGSTDATAAVLKAYPDILQLSYEQNAGKGIAMRRAFDYAVEKGFEYVITLDSDGQHFAHDIPTFVAAIPDHPNAIIIGSRNLGQENVPNKSSVGNKISSFWLWVETGIKLKDTQSGFRLYPVKALKDVRFITGRYEFEIEVLVRAAWEGMDLLCLPIEVYYPPQEERITHFRPFWDFVRISALNTVLCLGAFLWFRPRMWFRGSKKKALKSV
ncbi:MAG: glycosyltransferase family 2 protein [Aureispira sp.]